MKNLSIINLKVTTHTIPTTKPVNLSTNKEVKIVEAIKKKEKMAIKMEVTPNLKRMEKDRHLKIGTKPMRLWI